jgi:hypothetical protein
MEQNGTKALAPGTIMGSSNRVHETTNVRCRTEARNILFRTNPYKVAIRGIAKSCPSVPSTFHGEQHC